ncbi:MAG TPA: ATP-binding protein, partial [Anaerolineae bacterium]|nr:ATP-binding protein [Anaerolineae bacterium]
AKEALYRIAQEALSNIARHARAGRVELTLSVGEGSVTLAISDDGVGFDTQREYPGHLGLRSMAERAQGVGGRLEVTSAPGQGSWVLVTVPVQML